MMRKLILSIQVWLWLSSFYPFITLAHRIRQTFLTSVSYSPSHPALGDPPALDSPITVLSSGFLWAEGPGWGAEKAHPFGGYIRVPISRTTVSSVGTREWAKTWLQPAGYTGVADYGAEPGSNGLILDEKGQLISCEHGDRRLSVLTAKGGKRTLVDNYEGKRLNSPNDACLGPDGNTIYFTDPPYGLPNRWEDPLRELDFCGVYRLAADGTLTLLTKTITRPNGLAFSPDFKTLYVAQSDPAATWTAFPVKGDGTLGEGRLFYDATAAVVRGTSRPARWHESRRKRQSLGRPGGVYIFSPSQTPRPYLHGSEPPTVPGEMMERCFI